MNDINNKDIENILDKAGPRIKPEQQVRDEVYKEVHKMWLATHRSPFYKTPVFKIAASLFLLISVFSFTLLNQSDQPIYNIAQSIEAQGQIQINHNNKGWRNLGNEKVISSGDSIKTLKNDRLLVNLFNGNQFRVDENTHLKIESNNHLLLLSGRIYIDSGSTSEDHKLSIETPFAEVNHIGTQYSVSFIDDELSIGVRDGLVLIKGDDVVQSEVKKGKSYLLKSNGMVSYADIKPYDSMWQWTQKISSDFLIQDRSLSDYLDWVSSETGYPIKWESVTVRNKAKSIKLSGSINDIQPIDSLDVILPTTRFKYSLSDNQIYIHNENG